MTSIFQAVIGFQLLLIYFYLSYDVVQASHHTRSEGEIASIRLNYFNGSRTNGYKRQYRHPSYRTAYHFQPLRNWMNDPNGPMVYNGRYHFFYQYNPKGALWGNIVWAHSVSPDLINWKSLPFALTPSKNYDINGVWSGSVTILPSGRPVILYTGVDSEKKQVQNLAFPKDISDPMLTHWSKARENPLIEPNADNKIDANSFRDPTTAWIGGDGDWRVTVGSKIDRRGLALLFKSKDFVHWTMVDHPLHFVDGNGLWECPDFYPVANEGKEGVDTSSSKINPETVKYVFKVSVDETRKDYYTIGTYDKIKDVYVPNEGSVQDDSGLRYDYGKFYGSKTFFDNVKHRRILWGWVNESSPWKHDVKKGWHGLQNIPRVVWLDEYGKQLVQWPVQEVNKLRGTRVGLSNRLLSGGEHELIQSITASQADVEVSFKIPRKALRKAEVISSGQSAEVLCSQKGATMAGMVGPFGMKVLATQDMTEYTAVFFRIFKIDAKYAVLMCSDQSRSSIRHDHNDKTTYGAFVNVNPTTELNLRILIDHSIVESFGGDGKSVITARVYPTKALGNRARLFAFNGGYASVVVSNLHAWSMERAEIS